MYKVCFSIRQLRMLCCLTAAVIALLLLSGCQNASGNTQAPPDMAEATVAPTAPPTEPTEPPPTCPPDGNPDDITCQGSYTGTVSELSANDKTIVATAGDFSLNNALLQIYYQIAVGTYKEAGHEIAPDFSLPLDVQLCPLDGTAITWQQYFLEQALNRWHSHVTLIERSKTYQIPLEKAYQRNEKLHADNLKTRIYNLDLLYGYNTDYRIADAHQAYLDSLPSLLETIAAENGCKTTASLANRVAGIGTNDTYLLEYARLANESYMFFTTLSYYTEPDAAAVETYFSENQTVYSDMGISQDDNYINFRHILLIPEDASIGEDKTVTASEESWTACADQAAKLLKTWKKNKTEINFAELAFANSADTGSNIYGGMYEHISKGQLIDELDQWLFDAERKVGDVEIIQTAFGYHLVYLCNPTPIWYERAESDLISKQLAEEIAFTAAQTPIQVEYSNIHLSASEDDQIYLSEGNLLYPDIGHERFPVAPLYFQQDYPDTMYGSYPIVTHGCGITTMSMLVSYMTDEEWTPPEMCALYGRYNGVKGTAHSMFLEVPAMHNFHAIARVFTWKEAQAALEDGYMVVTLQKEGFWTRRGHYLLLHNIIETEDGPKLQVRDSNVYNYRKLQGHTDGYFDYSTIPGGSRCYWIYQKKVNHFDSCIRCAEPTESSYVPGIFTADYLCGKCETALLRHNTFISNCADLVPITIPDDLPDESLAGDPFSEGTLPEENISHETLPEDPDHDFSVQ